MDPRLKRLDPNRLTVENEFGITATIFANKDVPVESGAVQELTDLLAVAQTVQGIAQEAPDYFHEPSALAEVVLTPDLHKGKGVPIGTVMATRSFVILRAIRNGVNCGCGGGISSTTGRRTSQ